MHSPLLFRPSSSLTETALSVRQSQWTPSTSYFSTLFVPTFEKPPEGGTTLNDQSGRKTYTPFWLLKEEHALLPRKAHFSSQIP